MNLFFDGSGNGYWGFLIEEDEKVVHSESGYFQNISSNEAEYTGLLKGLTYILNLRDRPKYFAVKGDSQLVIEQMNLRWKCNYSHLSKIRNRCFEILKMLADSGTSYQLLWIPRRENRKVDKLIKEENDITFLKENIKVPIREEKNVSFLKGKTKPVVKNKYNFGI